MGRRWITDKEAKCASGGHSYVWLKEIDYKETKCASGGHSYVWLKEIDYKENKMCVWRTIRCLV